ncbi:MAG TPA: creatininase family protein [Bacteroides sp.]|nr:creatininase family protein [Bacteroides sp.]
MRPYILAETSWQTVKDEHYRLAVLPWGATEAHNYHLPYGTDNYESEAIVYESAKVAWERGAKVVVLPTIPVGVNTGQTDIAMTLNLYPSTQMAILGDLAESLAGHGIDKLLVVNGHGGNDFRQMIREVGRLFPEMFISTCNWFRSVNKQEWFEHEGDHADEMETSLMLHIRPDLVRPLSEAGSGAAKKFRVRALNESWAWAERKWSSTTNDTGVGDPRKATGEKGRKCFEEVTAKLADLMVELAMTELDELYM